MNEIGLKAKVTSFCSRVNIATCRRITEDQVSIIHADIVRLDLPEAEFDRISEMYLDEEKIPENIVKYFKDKRRDELNKKPESIQQRPSVTGEYTAQQAGLMVGMIPLAMRAYNNRPSDYCKWAEWYNQKCMSTTGDLFTAFLISEKERLTKSKDTP